MYFSSKYCLLTQQFGFKGRLNCHTHNLVKTSLRDVLAKSRRYLSILFLAENLDVNGL